MSEIAINAIEHQFKKRSANAPISPLQSRTKLRLLKLIRESDQFFTKDSENKVLEAKPPKRKINSLNFPPKRVEKSEEAKITEESIKEPKVVYSPDKRELFKLLKLRKK